MGWGFFSFINIPHYVSFMLRRGFDMPKIPEKVEITISPMRVISTILTLIAFGMLFFTAGDWIGKADHAHAIVEIHEETSIPELEDKTENHQTAIGDLAKISKQLADQQRILIDQQRLEREMWGENYEKKIFEILSNQQTNGP